MRMPLLSNAVQKCQPTHQMPASLVKRRHSLALYQNLLLTYFYHPRLCSCVLITNPLAQGGCAWVNRAVGACHVCTSGERSSQRWGKRWFPVIDSYLETILMELSKLYANSLFLCRCRCKLLRCTAHAHTHSRRCADARTALRSRRHIMGTQIFIRTIVLRRNTRGHCQISDPILLFGGVSE